MKVALWLVAVALPLAAQPKKLVNARVDARSAAAGLEKEFRGLETAQPQPAWIAYTAPAARTRQFGCDSYWRDGETIVAGGTVHLEPPLEVMVLFRVEGNQVGRIRTLAPDCDIDAGGAPFHWLNGVKPDESVTLLSRFATASERMSGSAIAAIALHADASAEAALDSFAAPDRPEWLRLKAIHWLNRLDRVISLARNDRSPRVRGQALFWLGQKAGQEAVGVITSAIDNDPERDVKRRAVAALRQLPNGEGIPLLIQVARTNRDPDVRKQAMALLGQSRDPRALAFFEQVLTGKP
jgi:hypothetical protein